MLSVDKIKEALIRAELKLFDSRTLQNKRHPFGVPFILEQDTGVEPAFTAWEAVVLPIYESCERIVL